MQQIRCLNRLMFEPEELPACGSRVTLSAQDYRSVHIKQVLRLGEIGSQNKAVRIGVVGGAKGRARIVNAVPIGLLKDTAPVILQCELDELEACSSDKEPGIDLLLAAPRPKRTKQLLPVISQLGIRHAMLTNASRVEKSFLKGGILARPALVRQLLIQGLSQQAEDTRLPEVTVHMQLKPLVEDEMGAQSSQYSHKLLFHPGYPGVPATPVEQLDLPVPVEGQQGSVLVAIGPEGGWVDFELELFLEAGFKCVSMGPRILRTDVATVAAVMLVKAAIARSSHK